MPSSHRCELVDEDGRVFEPGKITAAVGRRSDPKSLRASVMTQNKEHHGDVRRDFYHGMHLPSLVMFVLCYVVFVLDRACWGFNCG